MRYMDTGIATIFILCDVRTATMYDALWDTIVQLVPQLKTNINFIMSDFEMAAVKSLSTQFSRAKLTGCWFHFNQAVLRKWRKLHLSSVPKTVLCMTMALPLLPPDMFEEALFIIQAEADLLSHEYPNILQFTSYLRLSWSNMASRISTYNCPVRTNNIVESFHNIAVQKLGKRNINIWTFLEKLSNLIIDQELDCRRLKNNVVARRRRARTARERDSKIINAQKDLLAKRLPLKEFLMMFTTMMNTHIFQMEQMTSFEDNESSSDIIVPAADMELFSENFNEMFQAGNQNRITCRRSRRISSSNQREEVHMPRDTDQDRENSSDTERTVVTRVIMQMTQNEESSTIDVISDAETETTNTQESAIMQMTQDEESLTIDIISDSETETTNTQEDAAIYEVPEDDYGYLSTDANENNSSVQDLPFHTVDWTLQDRQSTSKEQSSLDVCTVCYTNERTHVFIPCGHLACCLQCLERLKTEKCPICNTSYDNYIRVLRS